MNKFLIAILPLILFSGSAFAEITPNDVVEKMKAGDTQTAELLTKQILKEHPDSAKAHYYMGQILATEGNYKGAYSELKKAASLDKSLSFASSPDEFREKMAKVEVNTGRADAPPISNQKEGGFGWGKLFILLGLGGLAYWFYRSRPKSEPKSSAEKPSPSPTPFSGTGYTRASSPQAAPTAANSAPQAAYRPSYQPSPVYTAPHVVNNYNSGNDGLVTGLVLGEMMSNHGNNNTVVDRETIIERNTTNNVVQPNDFDSGSAAVTKDDSFDAGSNDSSSFDSGSSNFDSGNDSNSSFDSGSSSFDSGGSSDSENW